jgi:coproporphyrinogen III oxidase
MIDEIEQIDGSGASFSLDRWGAFENGNDDGIHKMSGGITRVLQGGNVVEKGACSLTIIRDGVLSAERAKTISGRNNHDRGVNEANHEPIVRAGDVYSAAALSVVLHTRNPFIPTFRSDVRIFLVKSSNDSSLGSSVAWFGGGSDLTPYYLIDNDIVEFHTHLKELCDRHSSNTNNDNLSYQKLKRSCDEYFYLPARAEHRGTGGIFFDDVSSSPATLEFVMDVARMPSWLPIVARNRNRKYTPEEKHFQLLRRGRYLEFNLLYDRGVRFGLVNENPRVEGVMVSAPPMIAYDYNHVPTSGSEEERLIEILKQPIDWV